MNNTIGNGFETDLNKETLIPTLEMFKKIEVHSTLEQLSIHNNLKGKNKKEFFFKNSVILRWLSCVKKNGSKIFINLWLVYFSSRGKRRRHMIIRCRVVQIEKA